MKTSVRPLRRHLFELALLSLIPAALLSAVILFGLWHAQERTRLAAEAAAVNALADRVDATITSVVRRALLLADLLNASGPKEARRFAGVLLAQSDDVFNVLLLAPNGEQVFNVRAGEGPLPRSGDRPEQRAARERGEPTVSDIFTGRTLGTPIIDVNVPIGGGRYQGHLLIVTLNLPYFDKVLSRAQQSGGLTTLLDRNLRIIARSVDADNRRGSAIAEANASVIGKSPRGTTRIRTKEDLHLYITWTRTDRGWTVLRGAPVSEVRAPLLRSLAVTGGAWALAFALGLALAIRKDRHISRFAQAVAVQAGNVQHGRAVDVAQTDVEEFNVALQRLREAAQTVDAALRREREARQLAEQANASKDDFLAMLGHELRNPLSAIASAATVANMDSAGSDRRRAMLEVIRRQTEHLAGIVNDLLDAGRAVKGKITLVPEHVDLRDTVQNVVAALDISGKLRGRRLELSLGSEARVRGDRKRLEQIVTNLVTNAAVYTNPGDRIVVTLRGDGQDVVLTVADTGVGIAREDLPRVFDLFYQAKQAQHQPSGGLGIGLTLVKRLVELHQGTVAVRSEGPGKGACFTVTLPAAPASSAAASRPVEKVAPLRILIVEDNRDARESLTALLELAGHSVLSAENAEKAWSLLAAGTPDAALVDIGLPGMNGYDFARRVRATYGEAVCLVALSGYGAEADKSEARDAGFDAHVTKPVDLQTLNEALEGCVAALSAAGSA